MIAFGGMPQRSGNWAWFKPLITSKTIKVQFEEDTDIYLIYGYDIPEVLTCTIWKGAVPASVVASGYSQATNDADKAVFETDFKPYANRSIDDIPSLIVANSIKTGGGGANLGVNGAVTPVVFEYNPPNNYDIQVTALSLLFEDTGAFAFGNKFILNSLATLTNGLLLEVKAGDLTVSPWQTMKRTRDIVEISADFDIVAGTPNFFRVKVALPASLRLFRAGTFASPDFLRLTVRDDLSTLDFAEAHFLGVKL